MARQSCLRHLPAVTRGVGPAPRWQMLFLSQGLGRSVLDRTGETIGNVADLIVAIGDRYPPVTGLVVKTDKRRIFVPWASVAQLDATGARLHTTRSTSASSSSAKTRSS